MPDPWPLGAITTTTYAVNWTVTNATTLNTYYQSATPTGCIRRVTPPGTLPGWKPPGTERARRRARKLLLSMLDARQRREFEAHGYFHVHVHTAEGERRYRVRDYKGVERVDDCGRVLRRYCIHPPPDFPEEDTALAQLMLLETDEAEFLRSANEEVVAA